MQFTWGSKPKFAPVLVAALVLLASGGCSVSPRPPVPIARGPDAVSMNSYVLDYATPRHVELQAALESVDARVRARYGIEDPQRAVGVLDLQRLRLAMLRPDAMEYAASVPKLGILLAWFALHPNWPTQLDAATRRELGLMAKVSSNEAATRFSRELGLRSIQQVLDSYGLYDARHGGGLWLGKHYGRDDERHQDPVARLSHGANVRQLLRFYLLLAQGRLVSFEASQAMREILASPDLPHDSIKFVRGLAGRERHILRKWGTWEDWRHDSALVSGGGQHYILVALTRHQQGDEYLAELAREVDSLLAAP